MKTLIVYFSYTIGNTKSIAEKVHQAIGGELIRLETATPYPEDYGTTVNQGNAEVKRGYKPMLKPLGINLAEYNRIVIGTPTWWYRMAPAVFSFLSGNDLRGKSVILFATNAGWAGSVIKDMTSTAQKRGATVKSTHEFRFSSDSSHFDKMETSEVELMGWIDGLK